MIFINFKYTIEIKIKNSNLFLHKSSKEKMKPLSKYLKESYKDEKQGHYEDFVDEDTGEIVTLWVDDKPEQIIKAVKEATPEELQKLKELRKQEDEIDAKWWSIRDEIDNQKDELKSLKAELRELQYGMEDEIGQAKTDKERDNLGNEYGEKIENTQENIRKIINNIKSLNKKLDDVDDQLRSASAKVLDYEEKIGYR